MLPLQPFPLEEPVVVHAVEVVCEGRHAQVVVDQSGKHNTTAVSFTLNSASSLRDLRSFKSFKSTI